MKKYSIILICLIGISLQAQWTQEKGKGYYKIGAWWLEADEHYTSTELVDPNATRGLFITNFFGRYGLNDKVTLIGYLPHTRVYQNAQVFSSGREKIPGEQFSSLGDINLGGSITLVSGSPARNCRPGQIALSSVGGAVEAMARALAKEISPRIRINIVSPGTINTPMVTLTGTEREKLYESMTKDNLIPRAGTSEEVAEGLMYVIKNQFVTGTTVDVDGGWLLN